MAIFLGFFVSKSSLDYLVEDLIYDFVQKCHPIIVSTLWLCRVFSFGDTYTFMVNLKWAYQTDVCETTRTRGMTNRNQFNTMDINLAFVDFSTNDRYPR